MENTTSTVAGHSRSERHRLRRWLHAHSSINRVRGCGFALGVNRVAINLGVRSNGSKAAMSSGIATCESVWNCPVCSAKIAAERADQLLRGFKAWRKSHGGVVFATFTLRHSYQQTLEDVWNGLGGSWRSFLGGAGWQKMQSRYGLGGWVRQVEVTHGTNGWHVHLHVAFFVRDADTITDEWTDQLRSDLIDRWTLACDVNGFDADAHAQDVRRTFSDSGLAAYMNKSQYQLDKGMADELTRSATKTAKGTSRTPFAILADLADKTAEPTCSCVTRPAQQGTYYVKRCDICLWREWETTAAGRKQQGWSNGLQALLARLVEDLEADPSAEGEDDYVVDAYEIARLEAKDYNRLVREGLLCKLYSALEQYGPQYALDLLYVWKIEYLPGNDLDRVPESLFAEE